MSRDVPHWLRVGVACPWKGGKLQHPRENGGNGQGRRFTIVSALGHSPSLLLGMVEHVTTLEGSLSGQDTYPATSGGAEYIRMIPEYFDLCVSSSSLTFQTFLSLLKVLYIKFFICIHTISNFTIFWEGKRERKMSLVFVVSHVCTVHCVRALKLLIILSLFTQIQRM